jgi:hypothetical protein
VEQKKPSGGGIVPVIPPEPFTRTDDLPEPREPVGHLRIVFTGDVADKDHPIHDISACVISGAALFVAGDEAHAIERLVPDGEGTMGRHVRYALSDFLDLDDPDEEIDIEGLAVDDGWLWITGSHSRTRPDPRDDGSEPGLIDLTTLADLKNTRSRCILARIPLVEDEHGYMAPVASDGDRRAGLVRQKKKHGSTLARKLAKDELLGPSTRLAAKEGGLDIEGLAVDGGRVALGLRGPVIQTYAVIIEPVIKPRVSGRLHVEGWPCKRLVDLNGLGIRDMRVHRGDLWILAGPTQDLDGRCAIFRWSGWAGDPPENETLVRLHEPEHLFDLPVKFNHDHPEGMDFLLGEDGKERLLVFYDSPNPQRLDLERAAILADLFDIA